MGAGTGGRVLEPVSEHYPYSATQVFQRLRENGFTGGISIVREYVHKVRPIRAPARPSYRG